MKARKIILLALIAVLVCVYAIQLVSASKTDVKKLYLDESPDEIVITKGANADNEVLTLRSEGENWVINDNRYPADSYEAGQIANLIKNIKVLGVVASQDINDRYGLSVESAITAQAYKDGKLVRTISVGKSASTSQQSYICMEGKKEVLLVSGDYSSFNTSVDSLRNRKLYSLSTGDIVGMSASTPEGTSFSIEKADGKWENCDNDAAVSWVAGIADITVLSWAKDDEVFPAEPEGKVEITTTKKTITMEVYRFPDGSQSIGRCSESPYLFYLSNYNAEKFIKKPADLGIQ